MDIEQQFNKYMRRALHEARKGWGQTSPNPMVGAVIVRDAKRIASGYHHGAGQPHAEIEAIRDLPDPELARGADLYVTMEPCSTHGRTPPCTDAIIAAGFKRVIIGVIDPNPKHAGRGVEILRAHGIEVETGIIQRGCTRLNEAWNHWIVKGTPFVTAKAAFSLDGALVRPAGEGQWLTSEAAREHAHRHLRANVDAILIGAETLRRDNPRLDVRLPGAASARQPWRVVLSRGGDLPKDANVFTDAHKDRTIVFQNPQLDIEEVLKELGRHEILSLLVEGGAQILTEFFRRRLVQRASFYYAPLLCGAPDPASPGLGRLGFLGSSVELLSPEVAALGGGNLVVSGYVN